MPDYSGELSQERAKDEKYKDEKDKVKIEEKKPKGKKRVKTVSEIGDGEFLLIFCLAAIKDGLDALTLGTIGWIFNLFMIAIMWTWALFRLHKFPTKRFIGGAIGDSIPIISALPFWLAFITLIFLEQKGLLPKWLDKFFKFFKKIR